MDNISKINVNNLNYNIKDENAIPMSEKGNNNGVAELDSQGRVPISQLPSYVNDVEEYETESVFPKEGENGKIYIDLDTNKTYRWSGSKYVEISPSLALGTTENTAYRGDRGEIAYNHANKSGIQTSLGLYKISTNSEGHVDQVDPVDNATSSKSGLMSAEDKQKLEGIEEGAQKNQNAISALKFYDIGTETENTITADSPETAVTLVSNGSISFLRNRKSPSLIIDLIPHKMTLTGDAKGSVTFDGLTDVSIDVKLLDDEECAVLESELGISLL